MARQETIELTCDIHNSKKCKDIATVTVSIGRDFYELEMGSGCETDATLAQVREFGRKAPSNVRAIGSARSARAGSNAKPDNKAIREWMEANGVTPSPRGRIFTWAIDVYNNGRNGEELREEAARKGVKVDSPNKLKPVMEFKAAPDTAHDEIMAKAAASPAVKKAPARKAAAKKVDKSAEQALATAAQVING